MSLHGKAGYAFGAIALLASIPVVWFFWGLFTSSSVRAMVSWCLLPVVAAIASGYIAHTMLSSMRQPKMGAIFGAINSLITLVVTKLIFCLLAGLNFVANFPVMLLATLFYVGWFAALIGGISGWFFQRCFFDKLTPNSNE